MKQLLGWTAGWITVAVAVMLTAGAPALAQVYDRNPAAQARQYGYDNGYRDGTARGQHEGRENDPYDYHKPDWRQATRGYQAWMGPVSVFQQGYQQEYAAGFQSGFASVRPAVPYVEHEDFRPASYPDRYDQNVGYSFGRQDGAEAAREDIYHNKPFNPNPRGRYGSKDHGYRRDYGDKGYYKSQYDVGYHAGYEAVFSRRY